LPTTIEQLAATGGAELALTVFAGEIDHRRALNIGKLIRLDAGKGLQRRTAGALADAAMTIAES
jgi:hypothetical protein